MRKTPTPQPGVTHRISHDNLHIALGGHFDQPQAEEVITLLHGNQNRCNRIFIDTRQVAQPNPAAVERFKSSLRLQGLGSGRLIFKGERGFDLAINGNRVLLLKKPSHDHERGHVCKGHCAHCRCGHGKKAGDA